MPRLFLAFLGAVLIGAAALAFMQAQAVHTTSAPATSEVSKVAPSEADHSGH